MQVPSAIDIEVMLFIIIVAATLLVVICAVVNSIEGWWNSNPFQFPYDVHRIDVSGRRSVNPYDYIDRYICKKSDDFKSIVIKQESVIGQWKEKSYAEAGRMLFSGHRIKQLESTFDDSSFRFVLYRNQTRYRQCCYVKTPYVVEQDIQHVSLSAGQLLERFEKLKAIGFEAPLSVYTAKDQRRLMTPSLRHEIMVRDDFTCQICGKQMRDGVGLQIDHIIPVAKGGKTVPSNLQVLCSKCNGSKGAKTRKPCYSQNEESSK